MTTWTTRRSVKLLVGGVAALLLAFGCSPPPTGDTGVADGENGGDGGGTVPSCDNPQTVETPVNSDRTLDGCYTAESGLTVEDGATLTLEPGTVIEFAENTGLSVNGKLNAEGSSSETIALTGTEETGGWWDGVSFQRTDSSRNVLDHVIIEYGGEEDDANLTLDNCCGDSTTVAVRNTTLRHSSGYGLRVNNERDEFSAFTSNTITDNAQGAARIYTDHVDELDSASNFSGNGTDAIVVDGGAETEEVTWPTIDTTFRMTSTATVKGFVTIESGNTFAFTEKVAFEVPGKLDVAGSSDAKVTFTATTQMPGWWDGIEFSRTDSSRNAVDHAVIEYGGEEDDANLRTNNCCGDSTSLEVTNTTLRHSAGYGLRAHPRTTFGAFDNNTLTDNKQGAARVEASAVGSFASSNSFSGNERNAILVDGELDDEEDSWHGFDTPYASPNGLKVSGDGFLTLTKGVTIRFEENQGFEVRGKLAIEGTSGSPVTLEGTEAEKGYWNGLVVKRTDSTDNSLEHLTVTDAGGNGDANLAFDTCCGDQVSADVDDVTLENGSNAGISTDNDSNFTLRGCSNITVNDCASEATINGNDVALSQFKSDVCQ